MIQLINTKEELENLVKYPYSIGCISRDLERTIKQRYEQVDYQEASNFIATFYGKYNHGSLGDLIHFGVEFTDISILEAKVIEKVRMGLDPLEASTRYILMTKGVEEVKFKTPDFLDRYPDLKERYESIIKRKVNNYLKLKETVENDKEFLSQYTKVNKAHVLDQARYKIPAAMTTSVGIVLNARSLNTLLATLYKSGLTTCRDLHNELLEVIFDSPLRPLLRDVSAYKEKYRDIEGIYDDPYAYLNCVVDVQGNPKLTAKVVPWNNNKTDLLELNMSMYEKMLSNYRCVDYLKDVIIDGKSAESKMIRELELINATFDCEIDFGSWRDIQRHKMMLQLYDDFNLGVEDKGPYVKYYASPYETEKDSISLDDLQKDVDEIWGLAKDYHRRSERRINEALTLVSYLNDMSMAKSFVLSSNMKDLIKLINLRSDAKVGHPSYVSFANSLKRKILRKLEGENK